MDKQKAKQAAEKKFNEDLVSKLDTLGVAGIATANFLRERAVKVGFKKQKASGAEWTLWGRINLDSDSYSVDSDVSNPGMLSLIVHEARHLQQGLVTALSVYGELDAWQTGFRFLKEVRGQNLAQPLEEILSIPLNWERMILIHAASLMKLYSPGYQVDRLPLYPIHKEIAWRITGKQPD